MISSDDNVKRIVTFVEDAKGWAELKSEKTKLDVTEKLVQVMGVMFFALILLFISMLMLACLSIAAAYSLEDVVGSRALAFLLIGILYALVLIVGYMTRSKWLINPLSSLFSELSPEQIRTKSTSMQEDIKAREASLKGQWNAFIDEQDDTRLSPTRRVLSWVLTSANIIDGAILGWKLYRSFGKKKFFKKK